MPGVVVFLSEAGDNAFYLLLRLYGVGQGDEPGTVVLEQSFGGRRQGTICVKCFFHRYENSDFCNNLQRNGKKALYLCYRKRSVKSMVFKLRVTLSGIKGFFRVYNVHGATTLYTLHKQLRADLEFPQDAIIMFKALDVTGSVVGRYGLFDLGSGTVDETSLEKAVKAGATDFVYFYDVTNRKSVNITIEGEAEGAAVRPDFPQLVESKGPNPIEFENGYVAFEDLPDRQRRLPGEEDDDLDDEDFEDEEEDEDEDGKEIFEEGEE